ncbi:MAG TPA: hypothetical protein VNO81_02640 [Candidatus Nitrosotenuis sp.]|nr:hypothetical protein [Candidatus Nitrosotenuis sp.]
MSQATPGADLAATRRRILDFLGTCRKLGGSAAILGGQDLPDLLVFECLVEAFPDRRIVHLDSGEGLKGEALRSRILESFRPGCLLLATVTYRADREFFKHLERLLVERYLDVPEENPTVSQLGLPVLDRSGRWMVVAPADWQLFIHSPPGRFPFDEHVEARLAL